MLLRRPQRGSLRTRSLQSRTPLPLSRATPRWLRLRTRARAPIPSATSSRASSSTRRRRASGLGAPRGRASRRSSLTPRLRQGAAEWKKKREEGRERERIQEERGEHRRASLGKKPMPPLIFSFSSSSLSPLPLLRRLTPPKSTQNKTQSLALDGRGPRVPAPVLRPAAPDPDLQDEAVPPQPGEKSFWFFFSFFFVGFSFSFFSCLKEVLLLLARLLAFAFSLTCTIASKSKTPFFSQKQWVDPPALPAGEEKEDERERNSNRGRRQRRRRGGRRPLHAALSRLFGWLVTVVTVPDAVILESAGLDALVLTWCFKLGMQVRREEKVLFFFFFPLKKYLSSSKL